MSFFDMLWMEPGPAHSLGLGQALPLNFRFQLLTMALYPWGKPMASPSAANQDVV